MPAARQAPTSARRAAGTLPAVAGQLSASSTPSGPAIGSGQGDGRGVCGARGTASWLHTQRAPQRTPRGGAAVSPEGEADDRLERFTSREFLRKEAITRNEQAARAINESTAEDAERGITPGLEFACECGDATCMERLVLTRQRFDEIHRHPDRFAVRPGHEIPDVERVVEDAGSYRVVE